MEQMACAIPPELSLDCRPTTMMMSMATKNVSPPPSPSPSSSSASSSYIPQTVTDFLKDVSAISDVSERLLKLDDYVNRLEDEMKKIDAFKRELPLCMLLLNDAIEKVKGERLLCKKMNVEQPVLEEFIPLKRSCDENDNDDGKVEDNKDSRDKMNWMSSVQLWNSTDHQHQHPNLVSSDSNDKQSPKPKRSEGLEDRPLLDKLFDESRKRKLVDKAFVSFKGCSAFRVATLRKEDNRDDLPVVPGLSLRTPGVLRSPMGDLGLGSLSTNSSGTRGGPSSSGTNGHLSSTRTGSQPQQQTTSRKQRRCWSPELHRRFVNALQQLGGSQAATPKQIRELMQVDGLTNDEVKSHLQKYRLHTRRAAPTGTTPRDQSAVVLGGLWTQQDQYGESAKQSNSQSGSPEGPLQLNGTSGLGDDSMEDEEEEKSESHSWKSHVRTSGKHDV